MAEEHRHTVIIEPTDGQRDADNHMAQFGRLHPRHRKLQLGYDWTVRDVTVGTNIASGHADDEEDAEDQAAQAVEEAQEREAARVMAEHGTTPEG